MLPDPYLFRGFFYLSEALFRDTLAGSSALIFQGQDHFPTIVSTVEAVVSIGGLNHFQS